MTNKSKIDEGKRKLVAALGISLASLPKVLAQPTIESVNIPPHAEASPPPERE